MDDLGDHVQKRSNHVQLSPPEFCQLPVQMLTISRISPDQLVLQIAPVALNSLSVHAGKRINEVLAVITVRCVYSSCPSTLTIQLCFVPSFIPNVFGALKTLRFFLQRLQRNLGRPSTVVSYSLPSQFVVKLHAWPTPF